MKNARGDDNGPQSSAADAAAAWSAGVDAATAAAAIAADAATAVVAAANPAADDGKHEIVFIDSNLANWQTIANDVAPGVEVVLFNGHGNGLAEIAGYLAAASSAADGKLDAIHIVSHGASGQLILGADVVSDADLSGDQSDLHTISAALKPGGDILLYGCDVAAGAAGAQFIANLAAATGDVVAAATHAVGATALGGSWTLNASTGALAVATIAAPDYAGILAPLPNFTEDFTTESSVSAITWKYDTGGWSGAVGNSVNGVELTQNSGGQDGILAYNSSFSAVDGIDLTFQYYMGPNTAGSAADGLAFALLDGGQAVPASAGGFGGGLGYNGIAAGILGIGFDEYGNFSGGGHNASYEGNIVVEGSTSASNPQLIDIQPNSSGPQSPGSGNANYVEGTHTVEVILDYNNANSDYYLTVKLDGATEVSNYNVTAAGVVIPSTLRFGFTASTGGAENEHSIASVTVAVPTSVTGLSDSSYTGSTTADLAKTATADSTPTVVGTAAAGDPISVYVDGTQVGTTTADANGNWTYAVATALADGNHTLTATDTTAATSSPGYALAIDTPPVFLEAQPTQDGGTYTVSYDVSGSPIALDTIATVTEDSAATVYTENPNYNGGSLSFTTANPTGSDALDVARSASAATAAGVLSVDSLGAVYLGTGSSATQIGSVTGAGTSDLVINFTSALVTDAVVQTLARMAVYSNAIGASGTAPSTADPVTMNVTTAYGNSSSQTVNVDFTNSQGADSAPTLSLNTGVSATVATNGVTSAQVVDATLTLTGSATLTAASVAVQNFQLGDELGYTNANGLTGSYNASNGVLTISGTGTTAQYQSFLRAVTFDTTSTTTTARDISFAVGGGLYDAGSGRFYEYVPDSGVSWYAAEALAAQTQLYGMSGYLANVDSASDSVFVTAALSSAQGWLGASDNATSPTASTTDALTIGHWHWITGPDSLTVGTDGLPGEYLFQQTGGSNMGTRVWPVTGSGGYAVNGAYVNFGSTEPNDDTNEAYGEFTTAGPWNDYPYNDSSINGYVVEFGGMPTDPSLSITGTATVNVVDTVTASQPALSAASDTGTSGTSGTDGITKATSQVFTGTATDGAVVTLYNGDTAIGSQTAAADGTWSITTTLSQGTYSITAKSAEYGLTSASSAATSLVVDTTAPVSPTITSAALTDSTMPTIAGFAEADDTVTLTVGGATYTTVATGGIWSIPLASATPTAGTLALDLNGDNVVTADATDPAGNTAVIPATQTLVIDTTPPTAPTFGKGVATTNPATPVVGGSAEPNSLITIYQNGTSIGTATATDGTWAFSYPTTLPVGSYTLTSTATDPAGNVSAASVPLTLTVNADNSYAAVTPVTDTDTATSYAYDADGVLSTVQTSTTQGQLLQSVTNSTALINIYDTAADLIGTITQPSTSALAQPVVTTTPGLLAASTSSGPTGSLIDLLSETNNLVSAGNDNITVLTGVAIITATGPSTVVNNVSANVTFYGSTSGTASVYGGSGTVTAVGGGGGGMLVGGAAGNNVLVAGGGTTTVVGVANGDQLFASTNGTDTLFAGAGTETLIGAGGSDTLVANTGDVAFGGSGQSTLFSGAAGGSTLVGGSGNSVLVASTLPTASAATESMWGGSGTSQLWGGSGQAVMGANADINSNTVMVGGTGNAVFIGSGGTATAYGGTGNDTFWTGSGAMTILEGGGSDTVIFGSGAAHVTGGTGADIYTFINGQTGGTDIVANFKVDTDQIQLFGYDPSAVQQQVVGGNTVLSLADHTSLTLTGVTQLAAHSIV